MFLMLRTGRALKIPRCRVIQKRSAASCGDLVPYFAGKVDAWQIWNEPNLIDHRGRIIDPAGYLRMVREAVPAIRKADPAARVVSPGWRRTA